MHSNTKQAFHEKWASFDNNKNCLYIAVCFTHIIEIYTATILSCGL